MNTTVGNGVGAYLERMRAALSDLPPGEVADVLEDVAPHLAEVAAELGGAPTVQALAERCGEPEAYAAELRAAAGYPEPSAGATPGTGGVIAARVAVWSVAAYAALFLAAPPLLVAFEGFYGGFRKLLALAVLLLAGVAVVSTPFLRRTSAGVPEVKRLPEVRWALRWHGELRRRAQSVTSFLASLQPAWWVVRAVVAGLLASWLGPARSHVLTAVVVAAVVLVPSLWLGGRSRADRRWLWLVVPANALAAGLCLTVVNVGSLAVPSYEIGNVASRTGLWHDDRHVANLYVFDRDGKPLTDVYVYDQDGRPIDLPGTFCDATRPAEEGNQYPRPMADYGGRGRCHQVEGVPFSVAIPKSTPSSSAKPPTSATPEPPASSAPSSSPAPTTTAGR
ncbi:hypothetical protein LX15_004628 [Streptoalloteichus tenebrarius]|uniref:Proline-rich protein n=1 Tax=Streptoalloteichus tenebrarius (strain ATCC 17920 / DSM 40477 / JCM 4838 / CBS 697.72 / NBRC 16177 / NCIMB 11028 / NRRL B-12390 / A12253. 1 / ISP 5477) TaxID=1933 RepID=A0ABT1HZG1_STRSD|nr:hypothetical protein [Streptoalloteichus tenebrarius]MCP2260908.1 hypothetical protein [Streptoalloteichus tenebrarius]BFF03331.1 hypothetical protein GCM10020241_50060 [Streptoalloteichus tenebrarius]